MNIRSTSCTQPSAFPVANAPPGYMKPSAKLDGASWMSATFH
ncbi:hypothetical protein AB0395_07975 [Streptosporangium sp. NPDC051023]